MKLVLSKHQRFAALTAAAIIVLVQLYQFSEEGLEGYGWVVAIVVAAVLAILGMGPMQASQPNPVSPSKPPFTQAEIDEVHKRLRQNSEVLAIEVEERAKIIAQDLSASQPQRLRLVGSDGSPSPVAASLESFIRDRALLFSLGLVGIRQANGRHLYVTGIEYKETERKTFDVLARESIAGTMAMGLPVDKDKLQQQLLGELQAIRKCVVQSAGASKRGETDLASPLVAWLEVHGLKLKNDAIINTALQTLQSK